MNLRRMELLLLPRTGPGIPSVQVRLAGLRPIKERAPGDVLEAEVRDRQSGPRRQL